MTARMVPFLACDHRGCPMELSVNDDPGPYPPPTITTARNVATANGWTRRRVIDRGWLDLCPEHSAVER